MDNLFGDLIPAAPAGGGLFDDLVPKAKERATAGQAFGRGVDQAQGMLYGGVEAIGEAVGSETITDFGREGRERNAEEAAAYPEQQSAFGIRSAGDAGQWAKETFAGQAPMLAAPLAGAVAGGAIGSVVPVVGTTIGALIGAAIPSFLMGSGEIQGAIKEKDPDASAPGYALGGGAAVAALDTVLPGKIGTRLLKAAGLDIAEQVAKKVLLTRVGTEIGKGAATEGVTEAIQSVITEATAAQATGQELSPDWWQQAIEEGLAGALIGGSVQGATGIPTPKEKALGVDAETGLPEGAAPADTLFGAEPGTEAAPARETPSPLDRVVPELKDAPRPANEPMPVAPDLDRADSPRLTEADRASPLPNDLIDDGKRIMAEATGEPSVDDGSMLRAAQEAYPAQEMPTAPDLDRRAPAGAELSIAPDLDTGVFADLVPASKGEWQQFGPETGTLNIPRSEMPQIKAEHRGAMVNFLEAKGIGHREETVAAGDLKPTQAEFSRSKVNKAKGFEGGDRSILVSSDGHVLDGHHQWLAAREAGEPVKIMRLDAPIADLLPLAHEFPSSKLSVGKTKRDTAPRDIVQFLAAQGGIRDHRGELKSAGAAKHFVPGVGRLVRDIGMDLDKAREAAEEAGYLGQAGEYQTSTVADLLNAIDSTLRGERVYSRADAGRAEDRRALNQLQGGDSRQVAVREELEAILKEVGGRLLPGEIDEAMILITQEGAWPEEAIAEVMERGALAFEAETHDNAGQGEARYDVPFDTGAEDRAGAQAAYPVGNREGPEQRAEAGSPSPRREPGGGEQARAADAKPQEAELATERGAEGKPQAVIPGAERASDATMAQRKADAPLKAKVEQKDVGGLFGDDSKQTDLMDLPGARGEPKFSRRAITDTDAFKRWFGSSKVVDENGEPMVVYHGTQEKIKAFTGKREVWLGGSDDNVVDAEVAFFTDNRSTARSYGKNTTPSYLSLQNPLIVDAGGANYSGFVPAAYIGEALAGGYDGVIVENMRDDASSGGEQATVYITAKATQIKSATGNRGTFDPADPRINFARRQGAAIDEQIVGGTVQYRLSPEFVDKAESVRKALRQKLDAMGLPGIGLRVWESMRAAMDGQTFIVDGQYLRGMIDVAFDYSDPESTVDHEAIHAMSALGLFSDNEWAILSRKSKKEWIGKYDIARNYGMFPEDVQIEEGIAHAYADWATGGRMDGVIAASFKKIKALLKGLYQALTGAGFSTVEDIFAEVASGKIGNRTVDSQGRGKPKFSSRPETEVVDTVDGPREQLVIPGAERIRDKDLAERKMEGRKGSDKAQKSVGDLPLFSDEKDQLSLFQSVWHGTPHEFDKFMLDKIGTGEGNQSFGWGLYFASKKEIAEHYRKTLSNSSVVYPDGTQQKVETVGEIDALVEKFPAEAERLGLDSGIENRDVRKLMFSSTIADVATSGFVETDWSEGADIIEAARRYLEKKRHEAPDHLEATYVPRATAIEVGKVYQRAIDLIDKMKDAGLSSVKGKLYQADIPNDSELLVWDKELADHPADMQEKVVEAFQSFIPGFRPDRERSVMSIITDLTLAAGQAGFSGDSARRAASEALRAAGIPGHRYLDNTSRAAGDGSYNYVIYDENAIRIEARFKITSQSVAKVRKAASGALGRRIMSAIKRGKPDPETVGEYSHRKMIDYLHPLRVMTESVGANLHDAMNAYLQARLADDATVSRIQQMHDTFVTPMVDALARSGASLEDLHDYLYARHAPERNRVVGLRNEPGSDLHNAVTDHDVKGASGWSTNEAKKVLARLRTDPEKFAGIQEAARHMRAMLDANLLEQKQAGLISDESYDLLTKQWLNYVPLRSNDAVDDNGDFSPGRGRGFDVRGDEFQAATGRFSEAENIPAWGITLGERTHLRSEHNNVGKAVLRFLSRYDPKGEKIARVYWSGEVPFGNIEKAPEVKRRVINAEGVAVDKVVPPSTISPTMFAVKDGGRVYYVEFADEKVGAALKNMGVMHLDVVSRLARKWTGFQSLINTRANPAFVPINIIRDAATGGIHLLDEGFTAAEATKIVASIPKAWGALWRNARGRPGSGKVDAALKEYIAAGGKISFEPHKTLEDTVNELRGHMRDAMNGKSKPKAAWQAFVKFVGDLNDAGENGMRLAAYMAARSKGRSVKQAAFLGRDLTVDFKKHGEVGPFMNSWFVFFNASIQGNYNIGARLLKSKKVRRAAFMIAASGVLLDLWNRTVAGGDDDDDENYYVKMLRNEPWKFERQMVIFYGSGEGDYFSIPLPYGYNAMHHMGLQASAAAFGDVDPLEAIIKTVRVTFDAFNPIGSGGHWLNIFLPTVFDPAIEIATNQSFTGAPISPTRYPGDHSPDSQKHFAATPDAFQKTAEFFNWATGGNEIEPGAVDVSPDTIEHLWGYVVGGIGRFFGQTVDVAGKVATGRTDELEWEHIPIVKSFRGKYDDDARRAEYYRLREEVQTAREYYVDYLESGNEEAAEDFKSRYPIEVEAIGVFDGAEKQLRRARKAKRAIELDKSLSRAEKDEKLKPIQEIEMEIMNSARALYAGIRREQSGRND
jgi:hypothetical protein